MKKIVLLSDGTGNSAAKRHKTNVWRLYHALDVHREDQIAFYNDGVGSQGFLPVKLLGGAFGWGLKRNDEQDLRRTALANAVRGVPLWEWSVFYSWRLGENKGKAAVTVTPMTTEMRGE